MPDLIFLIGEVLRGTSGRAWNSGTGREYGR